MQNFRFSCSEIVIFVVKYKHRDEKGGDALTRITICGDCLKLCKHFKGILEEQYGREVCVAVYSNVQDLEADYEPGKERNPADILLMDIDMEGVNGIDVVARIQEHFHQLKVIFITGHIELSTEIFRVNPNNFLLKPIQAETLLDAVERARKQIEKEESECFVVTFKGAVFRIKTRDILYFESEKRTVILHGREGSWTIYRKLDEVQEAVPDYFLRCHQSYLVNMNEVRSLQPLRLEMNQGDVIPVSRPKYKETKERFLQFLGIESQGEEK